MQALAGDLVGGTPLSRSKRAARRRFNGTRLKVVL